MAMEDGRDGTAVAVVSSGGDDFIDSTFGKTVAEVEAALTAATAEESTAAHNESEFEKSEYKREYDEDDKAS